MNVNGSARQALIDLVEGEGGVVCRDFERCRDGLSFRCPDSHTEIEVLLDALREGVVGSLLLDARDSSVGQSIGRIASQLSEKRARREDAALWAVESWALAIGMDLAAVNAGGGSGTETTGAKKGFKFHCRYCGEGNSTEDVGWASCDRCGSTCLIDGHGCRHRDPSWPETACPKCDCLAQIHSPGEFECLNWLCGFSCQVDAEGKPLVSRISVECPGCYQGFDAFKSGEVACPECYHQFGIDTEGMIVWGASPIECGKCHADLMWAHTQYQHNNWKCPKCGHDEGYGPGIPISCTCPDCGGKIELDEPGEVECMNEGCGWTFRIDKYGHIMEDDGILVRCPFCERLSLHSKAGEVQCDVCGRSLLVDDQGGVTGPPGR